MRKNLLSFSFMSVWLVLLPCGLSGQPLYQNLGVNLSVAGWTNNQAQLLLNCESGVNYVIESSSDLQNWTWVLANNDSSIARSFSVAATNDTTFYRVGRGILPVFQAALAASGNINFKGNNITTDSFDSGDTNYSTGGLYDPAKTKANGDVITDSCVTNSLCVGNASIQGTIRTGAGGSPCLGPNASVGDESWVSGGNFGIQPGHYFNDMNVNWPDRVLPRVDWLTAVPNPQTINGVVYKYVFTGSGNYEILNLTGGIYVASGQVNIFVPSSGKANQSGQDQIYIAPGSFGLTSLHLFVAAPSATLGGNGVINATGNPVNFIYFGLPTNTNFYFTVNSSIVGCVYCPATSFSLGGGGVNTYDFVGACVAKSITMNGLFNFHFDENLERQGPGR